MIRMYERTVFAEAKNCCDGLDNMATEQALGCYEPLGKAKTLRLEVQKKPTSRAVSYPDAKPIKPTNFDV